MISNEQIRNHEHAQSKEVTMTRMKAKLNTAIHDKRRLTSANVKQEGIMKRFQLDYYELAQHMEDPRALQKACLELYEKYVADKINIAEVDIPLQKESFRQRDMLERKVKGLQHIVKKQMEKHQRNNLRLMQENVMLIKESNDLRREVRFRSTTVPKVKPRVEEVKRHSVETRKSVVVATHIQETVKLRAQVADLLEQLSNSNMRIQFLEELVDDQTDAPTHMTSLDALGLDVGQELNFHQKGMPGTTAEVIADGTAIEDDEESS